MHSSGHQSLHSYLKDANNEDSNTDLCQLHQLFRWRHYSLRLDLINKIVGDVDVAIVEKLAYDELVQMLTVFQSWFWTIHSGSLVAATDEHTTHEHTTHYLLPATTLC